MPRRPLPSVLNDDEQALLARILVGGPPTFKARPRRSASLQPATAEPAPVLVQVPPEVSHELIDLAIAKHQGDQLAPVIEPSLPIPSGGGPAVVCMLCSHSPATVSVPITNQPCSHCGFRALMQIVDVDVI